MLPVYQQSSNADNLSSAWDELNLNNYEPILVLEKDEEELTGRKRYRIENQNKHTKESFMLKSRQAVGKEYDLLSFDKIKQVLQLFEQYNPKYKFFNMSQNQRGSELLICYGSKELINEYKNVPGIGELQPMVYWTFPIIGSIKYMITPIMLKCTNQIPGLYSNPFFNTRKFAHTENLEEKLEELITTLTIDDNIINIADTLYSFHQTPLDQDKFDLYIQNVFGEGVLNKEKTYEKLKKDYLNAPNADPDTLLGAFNCVTRYTGITSTKDPIKNLVPYKNNSKFKLRQKALKVANKFYKEIKEINDGLITT